MSKKNDIRGFMPAKGMWLAGLCAGLLTVTCQAGSLTIANEGKSPYTVVQSDDATEPEKYAVQELTNFLSRVTGASFPVVAESALSGKTRGIYVGWTEYASRNGIEASKLGEEEWIIRSVGKNLILTGGRPRGTLYAVYEFLERPVGCHWLARDTEVIPDRPLLSLDRLDIRGKPWFWKREVASPVGINRDDKWKFMIRNKNYRYDMKDRNCFRKDYFPAGAFYQMEGSPRYSHSFCYFVPASNWFETHPEYFSLNAQGKRLPASNRQGPGQLCLTHPDVRRLTKEKLREFIAQDRAEALQKGCPPPRVYMIGQNDVYDGHCKCTNCQAIAKREGGESGPLIDFINDVAQDIEKDYPDILIQTYAYNLTQWPPKTIRPRPNVIIAWCDVYSVVDMTRPLHHPYNSKNYDEIIGWSKIASNNLAIGDDYWINFGGTATAPWCMIQCMGPDLKLFADLGAKSFLAESYDYIEDGENFTALKFWLAYQLLVNPYQPVEPLIKIFMDGYYGAASSKMNDYLKYLQERIEKDSGDFRKMCYARHNFKYKDVNFFMTAQKFFDEAEKMVKPGSLEARHVQRERFIVDAALLRIWPWLERKLSANATMPFDHETVIRRYEANGRVYIKLQYSAFYSRKGMLDKTAALFRDPKLPAQFRNLPPRDVADFNWLTFSKYYPSRQLFVNDKEAAGEMAAKFTSVPDRIRAAEKITEPLEIGDEVLSKPLTFGVTGGPTITLKPGEIPQDGKYHLFKIGRVSIKKRINNRDKGTTVWALEGKRLGVRVGRLLVTNAIDPAVNDWNAYISLKVKGPAYVKGSTNANMVWMDRVLLVKPQPGEKPDAAELKRQEEKKKLDARRPQARVPQTPKGAGGDPQKIDWEKSVKAGKWSTLKGAPTARKVEARFAQDGECLYVRLTEMIDAKTLKNDPGIFAGDDWELLFAAKRGETYRQIGINPKGDHTELAYGESSRQWDSGVNVISECGSNLWKVSFGFPLASLLPGGVKRGQCVYANILRGGKDPLAWSPTFDDGFHSPERMGEIVLE